MGPARRSIAQIRRSAHDPAAMSIMGAGVGVLAGALAVAITPLLLLIALMAPVVQWLLVRLGTGAGAGSGATQDIDALSDETLTEAAADKDWTAVAVNPNTDPNTDPRRSGAPISRSSWSGSSDDEASFVEY